MKRVGYLYEKIYTYENLSKAFDNAVRGKKKRHYVRKIIDKKEECIKAIQQMFISGDIKLSPNRHKTIIEQGSGKTREITIPKLFPDHIIHWAVSLVLEPIMRKGMYKWCVGSVKGRGSSCGKKYCIKVLKDKRLKYILKLDIKKFFNNIDHAKLKALFRRKIKDKKMLGVIDLIIDNGESGLPIGYYTSQWWSNFYLEELDHYIKEVLKAKYYIRYVDDIVIFDTSKRKLHKMKCEIDKFLVKNFFKIFLKNNWQVFKINSRQLDFLGFCFKNKIVYLRKRLFLRMNRKLVRIKKFCNSHNARSLISYFGWLKQIGKYGYTFYRDKMKIVLNINMLKALAHS